MKRAVIAATIIVAAIPTTSWAQMAVVDLKAIAQATQQVQQLQAQVAQLKAQYAAITGTNNMSSLLSNPQLRNMLPADWRQVYDSVGNGGYSGISGSAGAIQTAEKLTGTAAEMQAAMQARQGNLPATNKAMGLQAYDAAEGRLTNIEGLLGQVGKTTDLKTATDLQSRIAAEQARVANEQTKVQLMAMLQQNEQALADKQQGDLYGTMFTGSGKGHASIKGSQ